MNTYRCPQLQRINHYVNGSLPSEDTQEFEHHLDECSTCGETLRGLAEAGDQTWSSDLRSAMKNRIQHSIGSGAQSGSELQSDLQTQELAGDAVDQPLIENLILQLQSQDPQQLAQRSKANEDRAAEVLWVLGGTVDESDGGALLGRIDHYELTELLGSGSTGVVFSAQDTRLNREVAIKVLRPSLGATARERFLKEARAAASCRHENIVTVFDIGQTADHHGLAYITMELLPGETLEERLDRVTFLPEVEVRQLAQQVAAALSVAHSQGIIHRDLKPANIWIDSDRNQVKLLDFGLARAIDADPHLTATGVLAGTPNFMSPEQTRGLELDGRSDLFSLGSLLYRSITGRLPFSSTGVLSTLQAIQHHQPVPPANLNPACSRDLSGLIMTLLEKQPDLRPNRAEDVQHALTTTPDRWRFKTAAGETMPKVEPRPAVRDSRSKRVGNWIIATSLTGFLGWGAWMFGSDIVRIATNQGEIVIETTDKDVKIEVLQNGELVRIIDPASSSRIDLSAGQYAIQAGNGNGEFSVSPDSVSLSRGGRQIVRVSKKKVQGVSELVSSEETSEGLKIILSRSDFVQMAQEIARLEAHIEHINKQNLPGLIESNNYSLWIAKKEFQETSGIAWDKVRLQFIDWYNREIVGTKASSEVDPADPSTSDPAKPSYYEYPTTTPYEDPTEDSNPTAKSADKEAINQFAENIPVDANAKGLTNLDQATYNSKTFDQWLRILQLERNVEMVCQGIVGVGELSRDDVEKRKSALAAISMIAKKYGTFMDDGRSDESKILSALKSFFRTIPPEEIVSFIVQELKAGNRRSREFTFWISGQPGSYQFQDSRSLNALMDAFEAKHLQLLDAWIFALEAAAKQNDVESIKDLDRLGGSTRYWLKTEWEQGPNGGPIVRKLDPNSEATKRVKEAWQDQALVSARIALANCLLKISQDGKDVIADLCRLLQVPALSLPDSIQVLSLLNSCEQPFAIDAIPALTIFGKRIAENLEQIEDSGLSPLTAWFSIGSPNDSQVGARFGIASSGFVFGLATNPGTGAGGDLFGGGAEMEGWAVAGGMRGGTAGLGTISPILITPNQGLLLSVIQLQNKLSRISQLPEETAKPTLDWLQSLKKEVDKGAVFEQVTERISEKTPGRFEGGRDMGEVYQHCLNQICDQAILAIEGAGGTQDAKR